MIVHELQSRLTVRPRLVFVFWLLVVFLVSIDRVDSKRASGRGRKGKVPSSGLPFPNVAIYSSQKEVHPAKVSNAWPVAGIWEGGLL